MSENEIKDYYQCADCKNYFSKSELVKVPKSQNIIQMFKGEKAFKIVCMDCIKGKKSF